MRRDVGRTYARPMDANHTHTESTERSAASNWFRAGGISALAAVVLALTSGATADPHQIAGGDTALMLAMLAFFAGAFAALLLLAGACWPLPNG